MPAHFPKDDFALARFDGTPLYEDPNPSRGEHPDWGTYVFNFGRKEVRNFLVANALYWLEEFHIDGLRVDAVASMLYLDYSREAGEWTPNVYGGRENLEAVAFLQEMNATATSGCRAPSRSPRSRRPGRASPGRRTSAGSASASSGTWAGCTTPSATSQNDPVHRQYHHGQMTFSMMYAYSENYVLPISHDEVVHGKGSLLRKMPGDRWQQLANLRAFLAYMWAHPGKQLLFMGSEFGQESEWAESRELDWWLLDHADHRGVHSLVRDLNRIYRETSALWSLDTEGSGLRVDRRQRLRQQRLQLHPQARGRRRRPRWCASRTSPPCPTTTTASGSRRPALGRGAQHRRRRSTPAPGSATSAPSQATDGPHHGQPASATVDGPAARRRSGSRPASADLATDLG